MGSIDLEQSHLKDMTVDDLISTIVILDPAIKLVNALKDAQIEVEFLKERIRQNEQLIKLLVQERDAAINRGK